MLFDSTATSVRLLRSTLKKLLLTSKIIFIKQKSRFLVTSLEPIYLVKHPRICKIVNETYFKKFIISAYERIQGLHNKNVNN